MLLLAFDTKLLFTVSHAAPGLIYDTDADF